MMVSNHYPMITDQRLTWLLIGLVIVSGALARYFLVRTEVGDGQEKTAWTLPLIGSALAVALIITEPDKLPAYQGDVSDADALDDRCRPAVRAVMRRVPSGSCHEGGAQRHQSSRRSTNSSAMPRRSKRRPSRTRPCRLATRPK